MFGGVCPIGKQKRASPYILLFFTLHCPLRTILSTVNNKKTKNYYVGEAKMKGWKILLALGIVGMFVVPMVPATKATGVYIGDIAVVDTSCVSRPI